MTTALVRSLENTAYLSALGATDPDTNSNVAYLHYLRVPHMDVLIPAGSVTIQRDRDQVEFVIEDFSYETACDTTSSSEIESLDLDHDDGRDEGPGASSPTVTNLDSAAGTQFRIKMTICDEDGFTERSASDDDFTDSEASDGESPTKNPAVDAHWHTVTELFHETDRIQKHSYNLRRLQELLARQHKSFTTNIRNLDCASSVGTQMEELREKVDVVVRELKVAEIRNHVATTMSSSGSINDE
ncbi:MAG: hypothetical protein Q9199_002730 [Rusavskia elegans]